MKLCFGILTKTSVDNIPMFKYCWTGPLNFSLCLCKQTNWGWARDWEMTQPGHKTQNGQKGIPYHRTSCLAIKKKCSLSKIAFTCRLAGHQFACGRWWIMDCLCIIYFYFFFSPSFIKLSLSQSISTFSILILLGLGEWARGWLGWWLFNPPDTVM